MAEEPTRRIELPEEEEQAPVEIEQEYLEPPPHQEPQGTVSPYDQPVAYVTLGLTVGDGFKFGCGLMMAVVITLLLGLLVVSLLLLVASLMGVPVPL